MITLKRGGTASYTATQIDETVPRQLDQEGPRNPQDHLRLFALRCLGGSTRRQQQPDDENDE